MPNATREQVDAAVIRAIRQYGSLTDEDCCEAVAHYIETSDGDVLESLGRHFRDGIITRGSSDEPWEFVGAL